MKGSRITVNNLVIETVRKTVRNNDFSICTLLEQDEKNGVLLLSRLRLGSGILLNLGGVGFGVSMILHMPLTGTCLFTYNAIRLVQKLEWYEKVTKSLD